MEPKEGFATKKDLEGVERILSEKIDRVEKTLGERIEENSRKIDKVEKTLGERIEENSRKIDKVEKTLSGKIEENSRKIEENSKKIDRVALQVIKNSEAIDKMVTRDEFNEFRSEVLSGQDKMMTILIRIDQERTFTTEWIRRIEEDVEKNKRAIERLQVG